MMKSRLLKSWARPPAMVPSERSRSLCAARIDRARCSVRSSTCTTIVAELGCAVRTGLTETRWMCSDESLRESTCSRAPASPRVPRSRARAPPRRPDPGVERQDVEHLATDAAELRLGIAVAHQDAPAHVHEQDGARCRVECGREQGLPLLEVAPHPMTRVGRLQHQQGGQHPEQQDPSQDQGTDCERDPEALPRHDQDVERDVAEHDLVARLGGERRLLGVGRDRPDPRHEPVRDEPLRVLLHEVEDELLAQAAQRDGCRVERDRERDGDRQERRRIAGGDCLARDVDQAGQRLRVGAGDVPHAEQEHRAGRRRGVESRCVRLGSAHDVAELGRRPLAVGREERVVDAGALQQDDRGDRGVAVEEGPHRLVERRLRRHRAAWNRRRRAR